ncbi:MAG TPA: phosphotransferase [Erysipelothrix sp.]
MIDNLQTIIDAFAFEGIYQSAKDFGNGHINDTFRLDFKDNLYILQRINDDVFKNPSELMDNVERVTEHLKAKIKEEGGDPSRETLNVIKTKSGENFYRDENDNYWRAYDFIANTISYDLVEDPQDFYQSGLAFGTFQKRLADFPIETLNYTIKDFHHTPKRFQTFLASLKENRSQRKEQAQQEIDFVLEQEAFTNTLWDYYEQGKLDLKVTHNDTKLNNVLIDKESKKAICVVDLDTVMPGFALDDFGDSIRFGASTALEDEKDLAKVQFDLELYEVYVKGFLEGAQGSLSPLEIELFPEAARMLTLETGIRFLTDFLDGDVYFKTEYPEHNLVRARTQLKLVQEMDKVWDEMKAISQKYQ